MKIQSNLYALSQNDSAHVRANEKKTASELAVAGRAAAQADSLLQSGENLAAAESRIADAATAQEVLAFVKSSLPSQNTDNLIKDSEESRARIIDLATNG